MINYIYINVPQSALFFAYKNVAQSVRLFVYKNVRESASFFAYKKVTQSALFFVYKNAPPPPPISKFHENGVTQSVRIFVIKKT